MLPPIAMSRIMALSNAAGAGDLARQQAVARARLGELPGHRDDPLGGALVERPCGRPRWPGWCRCRAGPGRCASARQFMLLAVNMPEQLPQVGQAAFSISSSSSAEILPFCFCTPGDERVDQVDRLAGGRLARPPSGRRETKIVGMLTRIAPMNMPGTILSQLGMQTMASKQWAWIMVSTQSAMSSRDGQRVLHPVVAHGDAVVDADRVEQERHAAGGADAFLDVVADLLEMDVAGNDVDVAVADGDERLVPIAFAHAGGAEQAAVGGAGIAPLDRIGTHGGDSPIGVTARSGDGCAGSLARRSGRPDRQSRRTRRNWRRVAPERVLS